MFQILIPSFYPWDLICRYHGLTSTMVCPDFAALAMDFQLLQPILDQRPRFHPAKEPLVSCESTGESHRVLRGASEEDK